MSVFVPHFAKTAWTSTIRTRSETDSFIDQILQGRGPDLYLLQYLKPGFVIHEFHCAAQTVWSQR
jgi:hypothetical protein